jgi:hypothetical protein
VSARATLATRTASASLLAIGPLHALWATGSSWPLGHEHALADTVAGRPGRAPASAACLAVPAARGRA